MASSDRKRKSTTVPAGTYKIRYACGTTWYGAEELFGEATVYSVAQKLFHFSPDHGFAIELIPQVAGNLSTMNIPKKEW